MQTKILIVDDDKEIGLELKAYLEPHGYDIYIATDGISMQKIFNQFTIDLIVLDIMLPGEDGISLCQKLRQTSSIPIIMLSAAGSEADRVSSLEIGADDFLAKPFSARELLARIKALLRRASGELAKNRELTHQQFNAKFYFANWCLDKSRRSLISKDNITLLLSQREFEILSAFIERPQRILTRDQLLEYTRGIEANPFDRSIDVQIGRLRKKIEIDPKNPKIIITVRGGGYKFDTTVKLKNE